VRTPAAAGRMAVIAWAIPWRAR